MIFFLWVFLFTLFVPVIVFCFQVLSARFLPFRAVSVSNEPVTSIILIPAHNEEAVIFDTLSNLLNVVQDNDHIIVIADNCSDDTASIARNFGVEVIERQSEDLKGKGYALDFGFKHILHQDKQTDVISIIDADCIVDAYDFAQLKSRCHSMNRPVQALYLMYHKSGSASLKQKVAEFAWLVKNYVRPLGFLNVGLPCQLMGTGMAFPVNVLKKVNMASSNIVEDMKMGIDLAVVGHPPIFLPQVQVVSYFPETKEAEISQRTRWEHGHLAMIFSIVPGVLLKGFIKRDLSLIAMALDLMGKSPCY